MTDLAVLGTGRMGSAIAVRLCAAGHRVTVWNRSRSRTAAAVDAGALAAESPAEAVSGAQLVITMLADGPAVEAALVDGGAADALRPGAVLVQMSTIGPGETAAIAERLPAGVHFVDAPVGGSVDKAAAGALTILAGGAPAAVDRAEPVLRRLGTVRRVGEAGAGTAMKLLQNTAMLTAVGALHDTVAVAVALGIDHEVARELLAAGPLSAALGRASSTTSDFPVALAAKDLLLARETLTAIDQRLAPEAPADPGPGREAPADPRLAREAPADPRLAREAPDAAPVLEGTLRLLAAAPDQQADLAELVNLEKA